MNKKLGKSIGWGLMLFFAIGISLASSRYFTLNPDLYFPEQRLTYIAHATGIITHVSCAIVALVLGPFQFLPKLRTKRFLKLHRWIGRFYLLGILFGGLSGLYMAFLSHGGLITHVGFGLLAVLWLCTGTMAYTTIRKKQVKAHQQWMIRNYALTFAAVTLRLWLPILGMLFDFTTGYQIVSFLAWVPNLIVAEWIVRRSFTKRPQLKTA